MENWKPVENYEGYEVSNKGRVRSLKKGKERILKLSKHNKYGHLHVILSKNNVKKSYLIHTLVLSAFDCPKPAGLECRHLDGNPANNHIENLKWGTRKENQADRVLHGTSNRGERMWKAKLTKEDVLLITRIYSKYKVTQGAIAERFGVDQKSVCNIINRKTWAYV